MFFTHYLALTSSFSFFACSVGTLRKRHKVVSAHFINIIGWRKVLLVFDPTGLSDPAVGNFR